MRHFAWAAVVGLATTLATANVLMHNAQLRAAANPPAVEPPVPAPELMAKPVRPPSEFSRSGTPANYRQRDRD